MLRTALQLATKAKPRYAYDFWALLQKIIFEPGGKITNALDRMLVIRVFGLQGLNLRGI